jgi:hypothetical protein
MIAILIALATCGTERVSVKTLADNPVLEPGGHVTVEQLIRIRPPKWSPRARRHPVERRMVTVDVEVLTYKHESDGDIHAVIRGRPGAVMIAEFLDVLCAEKRWRRQLVQARGDFIDAMGMHHACLRLTGPIFFDKIHGQVGVAKNGIEIHPVLWVEMINCGAR